VDRRGYVEGVRVVDGHVHAPTVRRDDDGDLAAVATGEQAHALSDGPDQVMARSAGRIARARKRATTGRWYRDDHEE
jgi:hypothetical protein